jgi:hypothetical protein
VKKIQFNPKEEGGLELARAIVLERLKKFLFYQSYPACQ